MPSRAARLLIRIYQLFVSPLAHLFSGAGTGCRFEPTCSHYASEAFRIHGPVRASGLTLWRIVRCQPFARGGYDPVPNRAIRPT